MTYSTHAAQDKFDLPIIVPVSIIHWTVSDLDLFPEPSKALSTRTQTESEDPLLLCDASALPALEAAEVWNRGSDDDPEVKTCRLPHLLL